jgi:GT2 family glycosyltransferase
MNADCFIKKEDILKLLTTLKKNNNCVIVAPTTYDKSSNITYNGGPLPEKKNKANILNLEGDACVDSVLGCAMMIKKSDFENMQKFDENFFLFFSDDDLCKKIKINKKSIIQSFSAKAKHQHGQSKVRNELKKIFLRNFHYTFDEMYYYYKYYKSLHIYNKLKKKIFIYILKILINFLLLKFSKSIKYLSVVLAYYKFRGFINN